MFNDLKKQQKLDRERAKHRRYCEYCHHTMYFYPFEKDKKICSHCGRYNYKNDLSKFKDKLNSKIRIEKMEVHYE